MGAWPSTHCHVYADCVADKNACRDQSVHPRMEAGIRRRGGHILGSLRRVDRDGCHARRHTQTPTVLEIKPTHQKASAQLALSVTNCHGSEIRTMCCPVRPTIVPHPIALRASQSSAYPYSLRPLPNHGRVILDRVRPSGSGAAVPRSLPSLTRSFCILHRRPAAAEHHPNRSPPIARMISPTES